MGLYSLSNLYQAVILDHSKSPRNKHKLEHPTHHMELLNPTCGDAIVVESIVEDDKIKDLAYTGAGCAISMASASMMSEVLKDKSVEEAREMTIEFDHLIGGVDKKIDTLQMSEEELKKKLNDASFLEGVKQFPARYKCAVLAWRAFELGLDQDSTQTEGVSIDDIDK